jgi:hypothetical protein
MTERTPACTGGEFMKPLTRATAAAGALISTHAIAHEGHGETGTHWHATDVWGFVALAIVVAGALAWWRGRP